MWTFLKFLAAVVVGILLILAVGFWFLKRKLKKFFGGLIEQLAAGGIVPPFRIRLEPMDEEGGFRKEGEVSESSDALTELGFEHIGDFTTDIGVNLQAWFHPSRKAYAVVYDHVVAGVWIDLVRHYADKTTYAYATCKNHGMNPMPGRTVKFFPDTPLKEVAEQFFNDSPSTGILQVPDDQFAKYFQQKYAEEMNWNIQRGGPTEEEIRRIAELGGDECTTGSIKVVQDAWAERISEFLSETAIKQFNKENEVSRADVGYREYRIFAAHGRMTDKTLMSSVFEDFYIDEDEDDDDEIDEDEKVWKERLADVGEWRKSMPVTEVVKKLIATTEKPGDYEHLGSVTKPVRAEIWLRPEYESDDEYDEDDDDEADLDFAVEE